LPPVLFYALLSAFVFIFFPSCFSFRFYSVLSLAIFIQSLLFLRILFDETSIFRRADKMRAGDLFSQKSFYTRFTIVIFRIVSFAQMRLKNN